MRMKYFDELSAIKHYYLDLFHYLDNLKTFKETVLEMEGISESDRFNLQEELESIQYLINCQTGVGLLIKPQMKTFQRSFKRYKRSFEAKYGPLTVGTESETSKTLKLRYEACLYYLEKTLDSTWYDKLPEKLF